ncbi:hypothetical protein CLSAB_07380 [Clostridium saccharobutylicum]|nr:hypothetical protein CLSAB_07380 [Clostridium saccharobutylicum]
MVDSYFLFISNSSCISGNTISVAGIYKLPVAVSIGSPSVHLFSLSVLVVDFSSFVSFSAAFFPSFSPESFAFFSLVSFASFCDFLPAPFDSSSATSFVSFSPASFTSFFAAPATSFSAFCAASFSPFSTASFAAFSVASFVVSSITFLPSFFATLLVTRFSPVSILLTSFSLLLATFAALLAIFPTLLPALSALLPTFINLLPTLLANFPTLHTLPRGPATIPTNNAPLLTCSPVIKSFPVNNSIPLFTFPTNGIISKAHDNAVGPIPAPSSLSLLSSLCAFSSLASGSSSS